MFILVRQTLVEAKQENKHLMSVRPNDTFDNLAIVYEIKFFNCTSRLINEDKTRIHL